MKVLHLSNRSNRASILANGLMPSFVKNDWHLEAFKEDGLVGDKLLYTWSPEYGEGTRKYTMDMIYCKQYIHPRNEQYDAKYKETRKAWKDGTLKDWDAEENWIDFSKRDNKIWGGEQHYDLFELDTVDGTDFGYWSHGQFRSSSIFSTTHLMDDDYAHVDKRIFLFDKTIKPQCIKLVSEVHSRIFNNKIHLNFIK